MVLRVALCKRLSHNKNVLLFFCFNILFHVLLSPLQF